MSSSPFVSTEWLSAHMFDTNVRIVDASWYLPNEDRDPEAEFLSAHIPGAVFFDIDGIAVPGTDLPHMAAAPDDFAEAVGKLGISDSDTIVIYDGLGLRTAARAWWNFRIMGAHDVRILEGGLPKWVTEQRPLATGKADWPIAKFNSQSAAPGHIKSAAEVLAAIQSGSAQVVDVRSAERFAGTAPEPRPGLRSGHMPGSFNLPFPDLIENGRMKRPAELRRLMSDAGIDPNKPVIASCGSGVTATLFTLAMTEIGIEALDVYDGSWAEWGAREDLPVVTGSE
ncbi:MAG: 3-mercaptopyruvate sulfurtransferase [Hyphomicrobiaceae bacterium]|nr:3-mercaptopyruvate sulfurtransferase [Hyphomicrobiaceae bacterium]MCC0024541.1 3-mercaptopyruvate sulfurtransferase [Hyphomicrobiaceae bacterium]